MKTTPNRKNLFQIQFLQYLAMLSGCPGIQDLEEEERGYFLLTRRFCRCKRSAQSAWWSPAAWTALAARCPSRWSGNRRETAQNAALIRRWNQFRMAAGCTGMLWVRTAWLEAPAKRDSRNYLKIRMAAGLSTWAGARASQRRLADGTHDRHVHFASVLRAPKS